MKVKICGLKYADNILEVSSLLPDFMGFIFWEKSKRFFENEIPVIPKSIKKVGVFVDAEIDYILKKVNQHNLQFIQLHGQESAEFCKNIKNENFGIIKAFSIDNDFDFSQLKSYENYCDYFLFDTKGKLPGGNGEKFEWEILEKYSLKTPYFLSGGIGLEDVQSISEFLKQPFSKRCFALDVNSKFEEKEGLKNSKKLKEFKKLVYENEL